SEKVGLSSDSRLQLACLKLESLVIADQHAAVNTFPGLVHTARHITKAGCTRSRHTNPQGREAPKVWSVIGVKSYQGSCRRTCGWITSFLESAEGLRRGDSSPSHKPQAQSMIDLI